MGDRNLLNKGLITNYTYLKIRLTFDETETLVGSSKWSTMWFKFYIGIYRTFIKNHPNNMKRHILMFCRLKLVQTMSQCFHAWTTIGIRKFGIEIFFSLNLKSNNTTICQITMPTYSCNTTSRFPNHTPLDWVEQSLNRHSMFCIAKSSSRQLQFVKLMFKMHHVRLIYLFESSGQNQKRALNLT